MGQPLQPFFALDNSAASTSSDKREGMQFHNSKMIAGTNKSAAATLATTAIIDQVAWKGGCCSYYMAVSIGS